jgi:diguanylate cyclase (GGDEF)-like protein
MGLFNAAAAAHPLLFVFAVGCGAALAGFFFVLWSRRGRTSKRPGFQNSGTRVAKASERRDPVTGLVQREAFEAQFEHAAIACDHGGSAVAVLHVGLDNLLALNESHGRRAGDALVREVAQRLRLFIQDQPQACRLGGDEFVLMVRTHPHDASEVARQLLNQLQAPYDAAGLCLQLTASVGVAVYPDHGARPRLLAHAALAMRTVRLGGGAGYALFDPAMAVDVREQAELLQDLRQAMARGELQLYYQPKIHARSLQVSAVEALLRWQHPRRGMVSPSVFIPLAERHGLITELGAWVLEEAFVQSARWREKGLRMRVAVNLSGHQLRQERLVAQIENTLHRHHVAPARLTCEISETVALEDIATVRAPIEDLRRAGLQVSIDDFGHAPNGLERLRRLAVAEIKIDGSLVRDIEHSKPTRQAVQAVIKGARSLGLRVVAKGVETEGQRDALVALGCDEMQGFLFARPMSAANLALWADTDRTRGDQQAFRPSLFGATAPGSL